MPAFRLGLAAYGMRQWQTAREHLQNLETFKEWEKCARKDLERVAQRMEERDFGRYDITRLYEQAIVKGEKWLDVADYSGGPVEVADVPSKGGKGLIAKCHIEKGTLLVAEKAFAITYDKKRELMNLEQSLLTFEENCSNFI